LNQHIHCHKNENSVLPTRLIQLDAFEGSDDVRLAFTGGSRGRYACLSHRWIDGYTITTTLSNIEDRKERIAWATLPQTYQEAIIVARALKLNYIWIESLCIIQDAGSGDWEDEAPRMATNYSNAYITISASCTESSAAGLFRHASSAHIGRSLTISTECQRLNPYQIFYRMPICHNSPPLQSRGWVFQETLLSTRLIHFRPGELVFECTELATCECGVTFPKSSIPGPECNFLHPSSAFRRKSAHYQALFAQADGNKLKNHWRDLVQEYTRKSLTYAEDIFPALAGLAKQMKNQRCCEYYAGLWEDRPSLGCQACGHVRAESRSETKLPAAR
jgi:hypothetical protein